MLKHGYIFLSITALVISHKFSYSRFHLDKNVSNFCWNFLLVFIYQYMGYFPSNWDCLVLIVINFHLSFIYSENILFIILILWSCWGFFMINFWHVLCVLEENVLSVIITMFYLSIRSRFLIMLLRSSISLLVFVF